jgi:hypothetical protein
VRLYFIILFFVEAGEDWGMWLTSTHLMHRAAMHHQPTFHAVKHGAALAMQQRRPLGHYPIGSEEKRK